MRVSADSPSHFVAAAVLIFGTALAVLVLVHLLTGLQAPDSVPDCGGERVLDIMAHRCDTVGP